MLVYFSDFETLTENSNDYKKLKHTQVYLAYIKSIDGNDEQLFFNLNDYMNFILSFKKSIIIYFHNLSFDGNFIFKWLLRNYKNDFVQPLEKEKCRNQFYYSIFKHGNRIYKIQIQNKKVKILFKCSKNLLTSSISQLGKNFNLQKLKGMNELIKKGVIKNKEEFYNLGTINFKDNKIKNIFIEYIKQDVEIARLSYLEFKENIENIKYNNFRKYGKDKKAISLNKELTIGSISYKLSKAYLFQNYKKRIAKQYFISVDEFKKAKPYFYGGWTQFNPIYWNRYLKNLNGIVIDINSSYPFQMTKPLPLGGLKTKKSMDWFNYLEYWEVDVEYAKIKKEYYNFVLLKNWKKNTIDRYVRVLRNFKCYYTKEEYLFIKKIYDIKEKSIKKYYCEAIPFLKDFIEELYKYKVHYSKTGEKAKKLTYKIMLNALYGKQCSRYEFGEEYYVPKEKMEYFKKLRKEHKIIEVFGKKFVIESVGNKIIPSLNAIIVHLFPVEEKKKRVNNILIAAQITSYARLQIWETILKVGVDKFLYSDTDSIFFKDIKDVKEIEKYISIHPTDLGKWEIECQFKEGIILGAKRYSFLKKEENGYKFGFCGVNNIEYDKVDWDEVAAGDILPNAQVYRKEDDYGILIGLRDYEIKKGSL